MKTFTNCLCSGEPPKSPELYATPYTCDDTWYWALLPKKLSKEALISLWKQEGGSEENPPLIGWVEWATSIRKKKESKKEFSYPPYTSEELAFKAQVTTLPLLTQVRLCEIAFCDFSEKSEWVSTCYKEP